jgi:hypothetical protein
MVSRRVGHGNPPGAGTAQPLITKRSLTTVPSARH